MANSRGGLGSRVERALTQLGAAPAGYDQRAAARNSLEYDARRRAAVGEVEALCDRITRQIKRDLVDIENTVGPIAEPMADRLAKGAVADVFEAAAAVLKNEIRARSDGGADEA